MLFYFYVVETWASLLSSSSPHLVVLVSIPNGIFHWYVVVFTISCGLFCFVSLAILLSLFSFQSGFDFTSLEWRVYRKQPLPVCSL